MSACEQLRAALLRAVDGDASPEEALAVGKHLTDCTVCRIVLARERRLAVAIDGLEDPIDVDDSFLRTVMATLPAEPPRRRRERRGLRLAGFVGAAVALSAALQALSAVRGTGRWAWANPGPLLDAPPSPHFPELASHAVAGLVTAASGASHLARGLPAHTAWWIVSAAWTVIAILVLGSAAGAAALLALHRRP